MRILTHTSRYSYSNPLDRYAPDPLARWYLFWPFLWAILTIVGLVLTIQLVQEQLTIEKTWDVVPARFVGTHHEMREITKKNHTKQTQQIVVSTFKYFDRNGTSHTFQRTGDYSNNRSISVYSDPTGLDGFRIKGDDPIWMGSAIASGLVGILALICLYWLAFRLSEVHRVRRLIATGAEVTATVTTVRSRKWSSSRQKRGSLLGERYESVSESMSYQVVAEWRSPKGERIFFESVGTDWDPGEVVGCHVPVLVDRNNPEHNYYFGTTSINRISRNPEP